MAILLICNRMISKLNQCREVFNCVSLNKTKVITLANHNLIMGHTGGGGG